LFKFLNIYCWAKAGLFKSSTFHLEKIKQVQQYLHNIFDELSEEEMLGELDRPSINLGNGMAT
jgi:hypothetical protein